MKGDISILLRGDIITLVQHIAQGSGFPPNGTLTELMFDGQSMTIPSGTSAIKTDAGGNFTAIFNVPTSKTPGRYPADITVEKALQMGADGYVMKPVTLEELERVMAQAFYNHIVK